ncbi:MAG: CoB--CoM heterodisulfide reductase iron-sulfur subunit B family protein [Candidatus Poribacteria bacterium]
MVYTYYPGCTQTASAKAYDISARAVAEALGIELVELSDWNCCGATSYLSVHELPAYAVAARNLALAERQGETRDLVTVCNACYLLLKKTDTYLDEDEELRNKVNDALNVIDLDYRGTIRVRHFLDVLANDLDEETIQQKITHSLEGLKVAPYYGCQYSRPFAGSDERDFPTSMDTVLSWLSAEVVDFPMKTKCCGAMLMVTKKEIALKLVKTILQVATDRQASCIVTACPLCQLNLEAYQAAVNKMFSTNFNIPAVYFTQLLGLCLGLGQDKMGLGSELVPATQLLTNYLKPVIAEG